MSQFYERNIVEINNEYITFLTDIITPLLYEGILSIYNDSKGIEEQLVEKSKLDPTIEPQGILKLFQSCLKEVPNYNKNILENETNRIKNASKCYDWFDNLVKATVKSHIMLLSCSQRNKKCESLDSKHYENINTEDFIHKCYIESAKLFYNNPELFWHDLKPIKAKRNQKIVIDMIRKAISSAVRKLLPMKLILEDFLKTDPSDGEYNTINPFIPTSRISNIKAKVETNLNNDNPGYNYHEGYDVHGGDIRTSENGFEEVNNDNVLSDGYMENIQDGIIKLNNTIEQKLGHKKDDNHNKKGKTDRNKSEYSNSKNSQEIKDIVNASVANIGNIPSYSTGKKNKPLGLGERIQQNIQGFQKKGYNNIIGEHANKHKNQLSQSLSSSSESRYSRSSSSEKNKYDTSSSKRSSNNKVYSTSSSKEKKQPIVTEKSNFFANYFDD